LHEPREILMTDTPAFQHSAPVRVVATEPDELRVSRGRRAKANERELELLRRERAAWEEHGWTVEQAWREATGHTITTAKGFRVNLSKRRDFFGRYDLMCRKRFGSARVHVDVQVSTHTPGAHDRAKAAAGLASGPMWPNEIGALTVEQLMESTARSDRDMLFEVYSWWRPLHLKRKDGGVSKAVRWVPRREWWQTAAEVGAETFKNPTAHEGGAGG
jgi:hypothetical protein